MHSLTDGVSSTSLDLPRSDTLTLPANYDTLRLERVDALMSRQATSDKPHDEYASFETALGKILSVSPARLKTKIESSKRKRAKTSSASRVSRAKH